MPIQTLMDDGIEPLAVANSGNFILDRVSNIFRRKKSRKHRKSSSYSRSKSSRKRKKRRTHAKRTSKKRSSRRNSRRSGVMMTKKGQPYIIDKKTGRAKFIKRRS